MTRAEIAAGVRERRVGGDPGVRVVVGDDGLYLLRRGVLEVVVPGGHARPSGWSDTPPAVRRAAA